MKNKHIIMVALVVAAFLLKCAIDQVAGGSDNPDFNVVGIIVDSNGNPAHNTRVHLIPESYNPVTDQPIPDSLIDTTDINGKYSFAISDTGIFNVQAVHLTKRTRLLRKGIFISNIEDTMALPYGILKEPGTIIVYLDSTIDTTNRYVYIKGTTHSYKLSDKMVLTNDENSIIIDSVPETIIENVYVHNLNDPLNPLLFIDTVAVFSNKVSEIDGFVFYTNYTKGNSALPGNTVHDIYIEDGFKIWFATNGGVGKLDYIGFSKAGNRQNTWTVYTTDNSDIPSNYVLSIKYVADNKIRFATLGGAATLTGSSWINYTTDNSAIPTNLILDVEVDSKDNLWLSTFDKGLLMYDATDWIVYDTVNSVIPSNTVVTVRADLNDTIWCATPCGIMKFKDTTYSKVMHSDSSGLISDDVFCIAIDRNRHKWFGCEGGVAKYNEADSLWTRYTSYHSHVFTDSVLTIVEDKYGTMWFGTAKGMTRFDGTAWHDYTGERYKMLENKGVRAIAFDNYGNIWIGSTGNGVVAFGPTIK
ncbi:two-component regulator propeller domain-containing protein [Fibrobacterota bacterium]